MSCIQEQNKIISQTKHTFITNTQTSIGYVNNYDKILFIINLSSSKNVLFVMDKSKSKIGALVSEEFA